MKSTPKQYQALPATKKNSATMETLPISSDFIQRLEVLTRKLGYKFGDLSLPKLALTHRSFDSKKTMNAWSF